MATLEQVVSKSEAALVGNLNQAVEYALRRLVIRCYDRGVNIRLTSGYRSFKEQQVLYNQGRTAASKAKGEKKVTNAGPGDSMHNYGLAGDFVLMDSGYNMNADVNKNGTSDWMEVVAQAKLLGFEWGGDWKSFKDNPHIQMTFGLSISDLKAGKQPSSTQIAAAIDKIKKLEEAKNLEAEQNAKIEALTEALESMEERTAALEKRVNMKGGQIPPEWSHKALQAAKDVKAITTTNDKSQDAAVIIQMMYNMGLFEPNVISFLKGLAPKEAGK